MDKSKKTVLIIDDEAPIRKILELKFANDGYQVLSARNGQQGLELIQAQKPDAVISDINMPRLTGKELCILTDPIKAQRRFLTIIITARIQPDENRWIQDMQDTFFMEKPFSPSKILEKVNDYFRDKDA